MLRKLVGKKEMKPVGFQYDYEPKRPRKHKTAQFRAQVAKNNDAVFLGVHIFRAHHDSAPLEK